MYVHNSRVCVEISHLKNLINKNVPRDEVLHTRKVEQQVSNWRRNHNRSAGTSVFVSVPWLVDTAKNNK